MQLQDGLSRYPSILEGKTSITFLDSYVFFLNVRSKNPNKSPHFWNSPQLNMLAIRIEPFTALKIA